MDQWLRMLNEFEYRRERLLQEAQEERERLEALSSALVYEVMYRNRGGHRGT